MIEVGILELAVAAITLLGAVFGGWKYVQSRFDKEAEARAADLSKEGADRSVQVNAAAAEARACSNKLDAFVLEATKIFATKEHVADAFDRLTKSIESVGANVDRKMDAVGANVDRKMEAMTERLDRVIEGRLPNMRRPHAD